MKVDFFKVIKIIALILIIALSVFSLSFYIGNPIYYLLFTFSFTALLYLTCDENKSFFDLFIGFYLWLGFWLKYSLKILYHENQFGSVGLFNMNSGEDHDRVLLICSVAALSLIAASLVRRRFLFSYSKMTSVNTFTNTQSLYVRHKKIIVSLFVAAVIAVPALNAHFGIYQRGSIPRTMLPFGLNGIFTWLILFGLASVSCLVIDFEMKTKQKAQLWPVMIGFTEILFSNFSMLSRGMYLNGSALIFGINENFKNLKIKERAKFNFILGIVLVVLMVGSVLTVNYVRGNRFSAERHEDSFSRENFVKLVREARVLLIDRWVGIEGVMSVSNYDKLGWSLMKTAWSEKYQDSGTSWYDVTFIESSYKDADLTKHHFITLPGSIAFFFYPGSFLFLAVMMFGVGLIGAVVELFVYNFGGSNLVLCSLISQVVAYRFIHFGYVARQTYLLFGTITGNILIFYLFNKFISNKTQSPSEVHHPN